jgi:hypothetical protein
MNSNTMIALAIITAAIALASVIFKRWIEQRRVERMRQAILHIDGMSRAASTGEALRPWVTADAIRLLAAIIQYHGQHLGKLHLPGTPRSDRAMNLAEEWQHSTPPANLEPVPSNPRQAKSLRSTLMNYLQLINDAHQARLVSTEAAKDRIREAKVFNAQICVSTYQARARVALKQESPNQALHFMKRAEATIRDLKDLPADLTNELNILQEAIKQLETARQEQAGTSRLAGEADELVEAQDAWKKKNFD